MEVRSKTAFIAGMNRCVFHQTLNLYGLTNNFRGRLLLAERV